MRQVWFRWVDRELDRGVVLPKRYGYKPAAWNALIGQKGEALTAKYIQRKGRKVLYRNYRPRQGGEVDLVCRDGEVLVFLEVKTRTTLQEVRPAAAVDRAKERLIIRGANAWLRELNFPEVRFRFDIMEVLLLPNVPPEFNWIENAFTTPQVGLGM